MIIDIYSKRKKMEMAPQNDVYKYDTIPEKLRVQISYIWNEISDNLFGRYSYNNNDRNEMWGFTRNTVARELGMYKLTNTFPETDEGDCENFLLNHEVTDEVLDIIEVSFKAIEITISQKYSFKEKEYQEAIKELNHRFKENGIGYEFIDRKIMRIDNEFIHSEVIKPAINLLSELGFEGANDEFMKAHRNYRDCNYKGAIHNAQNSFESVMKTICKKMNYNFGENRDTSSALIKKLIDEDFIPKSLESHFQGLKNCLTGLRTSLESGLPTIRNKNTGHGQGEDIILVSESLAVYAINLAATNIVFLTELYAEKLSD